MAVIRVEQTRWLAIVMVIVKIIVIKLTHSMNKIDIYFKSEFN